MRSEEERKWKVHTEEFWKKRTKKVEICETRWRNGEIGMQHSTQLHMLSQYPTAPSLSAVGIETINLVIYYLI